MNDHDNFQTVNSRKKKNNNNAHNFKIDKLDNTQSTVLSDKRLPSLLSFPYWSSKVEKK
jgi:hypothetical protein